MTVNPIDLILCILLGYGALQGFRKGLLVEVASLAALVFGLWGAFFFADWAKIYIESYISLNPAVLNAVSYLLVFVAIVIGISLVAKAVTKVIQLVALGFLNRILGSVFGALKVGILLSAVLVAIQRVNFLITLIDPSLIEVSVLYEPLLELGSLIFYLVMTSDSLGELPSNLV